MKFTLEKNWVILTQNHAPITRFHVNSDLGVVILEPLFRIDSVTDLRWHWDETTLL